MSLARPRLPETDMCQTDTPPGKEGGQAGEGEQPAEDGRPLVVEVNKGEQAKDEDGDDAKERTAGPVDIGEDLGGVPLLGEGGQGAGAAVDARDADGDDRDEDDDVHEGVEPPQAGVFADEDKGGGVDVGVGVGAEEVRVVGIDEEADEEETEDVKEGDAPKDLFDGPGEGFDGVVGLGGGETDQFGAGKRKRGGDEDGTETAEAVLEGARVVPQAGAPVVGVPTVCGTAAEDEDEGDEDEDDGGDQLDGRGPEFLFGVAECAKDVDDGDEDEEDGDPDGDGDVGVPILDG